MGRLLSIEWLKWSKHRVFWLIVTLYTIFLPGTIFVFRKVFGQIPPPFPDIGIYSQFPSVWEFLTYGGSWQSFFLLGFLTIILVTTEFSERTLKQSIIQGLTRQEWFTGNVLFMTCLVVVATLYLAVVGLAFGIATTPEYSFAQMLGEEYIIPRFFLMTMGYIIFAWMIAMIFKRTGLSIVMYFAFVMFLEPILRAFSPEWLDQLYPTNVLGDLCPLPFYAMIDDFAIFNGESAINLIDPMQSAITTLAYASLFTFLIYRMLQRTDL